MAFKLQTSPTFWWPVTITARGEDGKTVEGQIRMRFTRMKLDEAKKFAEAALGKPVMAATVAPLITEWDGYEDDTGPVAFSAEALERLAQFTPNAPFTILNAFFKGNSGAREGN